MANLGSNLFAILAAIFGLGIMILVHEWGHFVAARLCGVRVDVFSFGYGTRVFGWKRGATDYRLSALPFGGYVRMAGDNPSEERAGAPDEFLSRPRWQRFFIAVAGPIMNFVLAIALMTVLFLVGAAQEPAFMTQPVQVAGVLEGSPAAQAGVQPGDRILQINGTKIAHWEDAELELVVSPPNKPIALLIDRNGRQLPVEVNTTGIRPPREDFALLGFPYEQVVIRTVTSGSPAEKAGLQVGDEIVSAEDQKILNAVQLSTRIRSSDGKPISLELRRNGQPIQLTVIPQFGDPGDGVKRFQIGVLFRNATAQQTHSLPKAVNRSVFFNLRLARQIFDVLTGLFDGRFKLKQLEGPVGIASESAQAAKRGLLDYMNFMAVISLNLGILNLLPIPILDGGHVLMLAIESVLRRDLSLAVKERFVQVGLVFLLAVFAFVMYYDILRRFQSH